MAITSAELQANKTQPTKNQENSSGMSLTETKVSLDTPVKKRKNPTPDDVHSITFEVDGENHLSVHMETDRLLLDSATKTDKEEYEWLICDRQVVAKYADWGTRNVSKLLETSAILHTRYTTDRWEKNYPYSSLAIRYKDLNKEFIGHVVLGNAGKPATAEIAYLFHHTSKAGKPLWRQGLGTEAVGAVVQVFAPETVEKGYKIGDEKLALEKIVATSRVDNLGSQGILKALQFSKVGQTGKFGATRDEWEIGVPSLIQQYKERPKKS